MFYPFFIIVGKSWNFRLTAATTKRHSNGTRCMTTPDRPIRKDKNALKAGNEKSWIFCRMAEISRRNLHFFKKKISTLWKKSTPFLTWRRSLRKKWCCFWMRKYLIWEEKLKNPRISQRSKSCYLRSRTARTQWRDDDSMATIGARNECEYWREDEHEGGGTSRSAKSASEMTTNSSPFHSLTTLKQPPSRQCHANKHYWGMANARVFLIRVSFSYL